VANGAPNGRGASDEIVLGWSDGRRGLNDERALIQHSTTRGASWSKPIDAAPLHDRPDLPAVAISPDGQQIYLVYATFATPWRRGTKRARSFRAVIAAARVDASGDPVAFRTLHRSERADARATSGSRRHEFIGDYNSAVATRSSVIALWTDAGDATSCATVNRYRSLLAKHRGGGASPSLRSCPRAFGNSDIASYASRPATRAPSP
jgi:hypothetical protein